MMTRVYTLAGVLVCASGVSAQDGAHVGAVRAARLAGDLGAATNLAHHALAAPELDPGAAVQLYLELARIQDRIGLHTNTRPVSLAMQYVDSAFAQLPAPDGSHAADVQAMRAELAYRAEMGTDFPWARQYAGRALALYRAIGDSHGEAEAVHRLGLIAMQRDLLPEARRRFEESRVLDESAGPRPFFQGEYARHIAFVELFEGNPAAAIPHLERSLELRRASGAFDAAMFAASSLAGALLDAGRTEDAAEPLLYSLTIAASIDSPVGRARNSLVAGRFHAARGEVEAARRAFEEAGRLAAAVRSEGLAREAQEGLGRLGRGR